MKSVWRFIAIISIFVSIVGLGAPRSLLKTEFDYAFYAGPSIRVHNGIDRVSVYAIPTGHSMINPRIGEEVYEKGYASYKVPFLKDESNITIHCISSTTGEPHGIISDFENRFQFSTLVFVNNKTSENGIMRFNKQLQGEMPNDEITLDITQLIQEYNLTFPFKIWTETLVDYTIMNEHGQNSSRYRVNEFSLTVDEDQMLIESFSDIPKVKLLGISTRINDIRAIGWVCLGIGMISYSWNWIKSKELF